MQDIVHVGRPIHACPRIYESHWCPCHWLLAQDMKKQYCIHFLSQKTVIWNITVTRCSAAMPYCTSSSFVPLSGTDKSANPMTSLLVMTFRTITIISTCWFFYSPWLLLLFFAALLVPPGSDYYRLVSCLTKPKTFSFPHLLCLCRLDLPSSALTSAQEQWHLGNPNGHWAACFSFGRGLHFLYIDFQPLRDPSGCCSRLAASSSSTCHPMQMETRQVGNRRPAKTRGGGMKKTDKNARRLHGLGTRAVPSCQHWNPA